MERTLDGQALRVLGIPSAYYLCSVLFQLIPHAESGKCGAYSKTLANANCECRKIPTMLADHVEKNNLQGKLKFSLFVGASSGAETENRWARLNMIERRSPHQVGKEIAKGINNGNINFFDKHLSMFPVDLVYVSAGY